MNYFKPEKHYYIIPILKIDSGIKICSSNGEVNHTLHDYMNERFPILKELDRERADICYNDPLWSTKPHVAGAKHKKQLELIEEAIDYLNIPKHILVIGTDDEAIEPVTKLKIKNSTSVVKSLWNYRVSDCELPHYWIHDYEEKIKNFIAPSPSLIELVHKPKDDFVKEVTLTKQGAKIKTIK